MSCSGYACAFYYKRKKSKKLPFKGKIGLVKTPYCFLKKHWRINICYSQTMCWQAHMMTSASSWTQFHLLCVCACVQEWVCKKEGCLKDWYQSEFWKWKKAAFSHPSLPCSQTCSTFERVNPYRFTENTWHEIRNIFYFRTTTQNNLLLWNALTVQEIKS